MHIEPASVDDAFAIAEVHVIAWQHTYSGIVPADILAQLSVQQREAIWADSIAKGVPDLLVARTEGQVAGFIAFGPCRDEGRSSEEAEIWAIYLRPTALSTGIGRALWLAANQRMIRQGYRSVSLWVFTNNHRAIKFYTAAGFRVQPETQKDSTFGGAQAQKIRYVQVISE
jgi:ribosomal protein S18 acetylase RimI-like enzyme